MSDEERKAEQAKAVKEAIAQKSNLVRSASLKALVEVRKHPDAKDK